MELLDESGSQLFEAADDTDGEEQTSGKSWKLGQDSEKPTASSTKRVEHWTE